MATLYQSWFLIFVFPRAFRSKEGFGHLGYQGGNVGQLVEANDRGANYRFGSPSRGVRGDTTPPISIIICFRNEAERLANYLPLILEQDHPDFEVVAVDDFSTDSSARVVADLQLRYEHLRLVHPTQSTRPGKKDALTFGINKARHDILLLTDADCAPATKNWITSMTAPFQKDHIELVIGYSPYRRRSGWLNFFQRFETTYTAFQYLGLARIGLPYMAVGRNVAYRKTFFQRAGGLESHAHLPGGDDDLLVSQHARSSATAIVTCPVARTISDSATDWLDYWRRKMRHVGVGVAYPILPKVLIGGLALSHLLWYGLAIYGLLAGMYWWLSLVLLRLMLVGWNYNYNHEQNTEDTLAGFFSKSGRLPGILAADFFLGFYYAFTAPALLFAGSKGGWK